MPIKIHELVVRLNLSDRTLIDRDGSNFYNTVNLDHNSYHDAFVSLFSKERKKILGEPYNGGKINNER